MNTRWIAGFLLSVAVLTGTAAACIWDSETTVVEERGLPSVMDAIVGKYPVHTEEYWNWRIETASAALRDDPRDLDAMNDLAVAYEKLGQSERAIQGMRDKLDLVPRDYTAHANLGTFLVHAAMTKEGSEKRALLAEGLDHLRLAVEINPDAHFGRERYQIMAVEWLIEVHDAPELAATTTFLGIPAAGPRVKTIDTLEDRGLDGDVFAAIVGMMRFGGVDGKVWPQFYRCLALLVDEVSLMGMIEDPRSARRSSPLLHDPWEIAFAAYTRFRAAGGEQLLPGESWFAGAADTYGERVAARIAEAAEWRAAYQSHERELLSRKLDPTRDEHWIEFYRAHGKFDPIARFRRSTTGLYFDATVERVAIAVVVLGGLLFLRSRRARARAALRAAS